MAGPATSLRATSLRAAAGRPAAGAARPEPAGLELTDGLVSDVRIAWGGIAHKPWRATIAEEALRGQPLTEDAVRGAVDLELAAAVTDDGSAYKVPMVRSITAHVLVGLAEQEEAR